MAGTEVQETWLHEIMHRTISDCWVIKIDMEMGIAVIPQ